MNLDWFPLILVTLFPFVNDWSKDEHVTQIWPMRLQKSIPISLWQKELVHIPLSFAFGNYCERMITGCWSNHPVTMRRNITVTLKRAKKKYGGKFRSSLTLFATAPFLEQPPLGFLLSERVKCHCCLRYPYQVFSSLRPTAFLPYMTHYLENDSLAAGWQDSSDWDYWTFDISLICSRGFLEGLETNWILVNHSWRKISISGKFPQSGK